jgi:VWFA-related protein
MTRLLPVFLLCAAGFAQLPTPQARAPRVSSNRQDLPLFQVDAAVTDANGRTVKGLTLDDFDLLVENTPQKLAKVSYIDTRPRRTIVLIVDDLRLSSESLGTVRQSIREFVERDVRTADRVAILCTSGGSGVTQQFTSDRKLLDSAINAIPFPIGATATGSYGAGTIGTLRAVMTGLNELPGRKSVILFSESLRASAGESASHTPAAMQLIVEMARVASAVFYGINARVEMIEKQSAAVPWQGARPQAPVLSFTSSSMIQLGSGLEDVARGTGGLFLDRPKSIGEGIAEVLRDQEGVYRIAFRSDVLAHDYAMRWIYEKVTVKAKSPGLRVRLRNAPDHEATETETVPQQLEPEDIVRGLSCPFSAGDFQVQITPLVSNTQKEGTYVNAVVRIDGRAMTFTKPLKGIYTATVIVTAGLFGADGQLIRHADRAATARIADPGYPNAHNQDATLTVQLPIADPGAYQLRVLVSDQTSGRVGSARRFFTAPDLAGNQLGISGIVLHGDGEKTGQGDGANPAARVFRPDARLRYSYIVFNLLADAEKRSKAEVKTQLFRDGSSVYEGAWLPLAFDPATDLKRRSAVGTVNLSNMMQPGRYFFVVTVKDTLAKSEAPRMSSQCVDFEIRP